MRGRLRGGGAAAGGKVAERERRMAQAELGHLAQVGAHVLEPALTAETLDRPDLGFGRTARAAEIRVIRVCEPVRAGPGGRDDGPLPEREGGVARAEEGEQVGDRLAPLRVRERVPASLDHAELEPLGRRDTGEVAGPVQVYRAQLEMRGSRAGDRARGEECAAQVGGAAARPAGHARGRPRERAVARAEDPRRRERLDRALVVCEVELVAGRPVERTPLERADLARDAVRMEERDRPPGDVRAPQLQVKPDPPAAPQVDASRPSDERRQLRQTAAGLARLDRRELRADFLGEAQSAPSSSSSRRL